MIKIELFEYYNDENEADNIKDNEDIGGNNDDNRADENDEVMAR